MPASPRIDNGAILDATLAAVQRLGVRKLTVIDVAAEAGISRHTIYRRFAGKPELLDALGNHLVQRFYDDLLTAAEQQPDPLERARVIVATVVRLSREWHLGTLIEVEPVFYRRFVARRFPEWADVVMRMLVWPESLPSDGPGRRRLEIAADAILRQGVSYHVLAPQDWEREREALTEVAEALLAPRERSSRRRLTRT